MKTKLVMSLVVVVLLLPTGAKAQTQEEEFRSLLLATISLLQEQISRLQEAVAMRNVEGREVVSNALEDNSQSSNEGPRYTGAFSFLNEPNGLKEYENQLRSAMQQGAPNTAAEIPTVSESEVEGTYDVSGSLIAAQEGTSLTADHRELWELFVDTVGEGNARVYVNEFEVFDSRASEFDAISEQAGINGQWKLSVNEYSFDLESERDRSEIQELYIHEFGHIRLREETELVSAFLDRFWSGDEEQAFIARLGQLFSNLSARNDAIREFYRDNQSDFVSQYAASPREDIAESFMVFVTEDRRSGSLTRDRKVNFFYDYPEMVELRDQIRDNL